MSTVGTPKSAEQIQHDWDTNPRWRDVTRTYSAEDVVALQGHVVDVVPDSAVEYRRASELLDDPDSDAVEA